MDTKQRIQCAQGIVSEEIDTLNLMLKNISATFSDIVQELIECSGKVILCGMGKSGHVARKISATMASLGTPSFFLHPAEALHGDLGMVSENDVVVLISNSGETEEILRLIPSLKVIGAKLIALSGNGRSSLAKSVDISQEIIVEQEACFLNLAPTSSTTAMLVYGDALAIVASIENGFRESDFGLFHPAGTLGKRVLVRVKDIMKKGEKMPVVLSGVKITDAIMEMSNKGLGVVAIVDERKKLVGLLTDGDLRRAIERHANLYGDIVDTIMTKKPKTITKDILLVEALKKLKENKLNNYPVVDTKNQVVGVITWQMIVQEGIIL